jgi:hypothetical protein
MDLEQNPRSEKYRDSAETLRRLAGRLHFDFNRRSQLLALADEFDRLADYVEGLSPMTAGERPE